MNSAVRETLNCSVCHSIYTDLVTDHNVCQGCTVNVLNTQKESEVYSCPEFREEFQDCPASLIKSCNIVEPIHHAQREHNEFGILCTYCEFNVPAVKSCLQCDASLCEIHLKKHSKLEEHVLIEPTTSLKWKKCSMHNEILKYYCCQDAVCICVSCGLFGDHKGHEIELLNESFIKKEKVKLNKIMEQLSSRKEKTENRIQKLRKHVKDIPKKASDLAERVTEQIKDVKQLLDILEKKVQREIKRQEEQVSQRASEFLQELAEKSDELSNKILQIQSLHDVTEYYTLPWVVNIDTNDSDKDFDGNNEFNIIGSLDEASISLMLDKGLLNFADLVNNLSAKRQFLDLEIPDLSLDVSTANNYIIVSDDLKSASFATKNQRRPDGLERFESCQVLSVESFSSGQHYWEVDVSKAKVWNIGVVYQSIERKIDGQESYIGFNDKSWGLAFQNTLGALHNKRGQKVTSPSVLQTVGIYLNYETGQLSFYERSDTKRHLHTFTAKFTEPLHAAFFICEDSCITVKSVKSVLKK